MKKNILIVAIATLVASLIGIAIGFRAYILLAKVSGTVSEYQAPQVYVARMYNLNEVVPVPEGYRELVQLPVNSHFWLAPNGLAVRIAEVDYSQGNDIVIVEFGNLHMSGEIRIDAGLANHFELDGYRIVIFQRWAYDNDYHYWLQVLEPVK